MRGGKEEALRPVRVLHLIPSLIGGGAQRQLGYLANVLASRGHDVHIAYVAGGSEESPIDLKAVTLHRLPIRGNHDPSLLYRLFRLIKALRPGLVQTWLLQMDVAGGIAAKLCGTKWVLREPAVDTAYQRSWKFRLRELVAKRCDAIVSNSTAGTEYWSRCVRSTPMRTIRNAVPIERIARTQPVHSQAIGCEPGIPTVLYAGRLVSDRFTEKNLSSLLEAVRIANVSEPCLAIVAGDGPQRGALERQARQLGMHRRVVFTGQLAPDFLWGLMKSASAYALLSSFEGMPNAAMEAVACGCPVVLSDIRGHRDLVPDDMAIFVKHDDPDAIARALIDCIRNAPAASDRAARALGYAQRWSIEHMADEYARLYDELLEGRA